MREESVCGVENCGKYWWYCCCTRFSEWLLIVFGYRECDHVVGCKVGSLVIEWWWVEFIRSYAMVKVADVAQRDVWSASVWVMWVLRRCRTSNTTIVLLHLLQQHLLECEVIVIDGDYTTISAGR